uniref:Uncharacterized protein n=1 Tax=Loa loa TaxID=7209 RepID=A0A1I7VM76_LOALO
MGESSAQPVQMKEVNSVQLIGTKEMNSVQSVGMKEVNSNESLNGSMKSVASQDQQKNSSKEKTDTSVTESAQQQQSISEIRNEECPKESRTAAGAEGDVGGSSPELQQRNLRYFEFGLNTRQIMNEFSRKDEIIKIVVLMIKLIMEWLNQYLWIKIFSVEENTMEVVRLEETSNETKNSGILSYMRHPSEGHCLMIGSNWREFGPVPVLNAGRTGRVRLRNRLFIKKCRNK